MHILQRIRNNPIAVLSVLAVALIAWVAVDLFPSQSPVPNLDPAAFPPSKIKKFLPSPPEEPSHHAASVSVGMLSKVKPGMTRIEVEQILGPPAPDQLQPVTQTNGGLTYCTAYELINSELPTTIRPIQPKASRTSIQSTPVDPKSQVTLQYDASKPGHPLIEVHYPNPVF